jgi:hypothetical protein
MIEESDEIDEIEENEVTGFGHGEDEATVKKVLKRESTVLLEPDVSVNADRPEDETG